ncbi:MAG TPA: hypothetical protein VGO58_05100, partial [Chitinophagaceae bacterium]|nr:hypothetical protein [Chitinophagaceae bacterium]
MERIEALIGKLKEQFEQNADPSLLLGTVQLLQFELTKLKSIGQQSLGTAKVAVMLPVAGMLGAVASGYEKYAPKPLEKVVQEPEVPVKTQDTRIKETILIDDGTLSVVQRNGQLDMVFDPMTEIPTLSHQPREVNDNGTPGESLNDKLKQGKTELVEILKETPVKDLRKAVGINDRFVFINELFRGDENMYERSIKTINTFNIYAEAEYWISRELKLKLAWNNDNQTVQHFDQ